VIAGEERRGGRVGCEECAVERKITSYRLMLFMYDAVHLKVTSWLITDMA